MELNPKFISEIKSFSEKLVQEDEVLVVSHHDADGITACAVVVDLLRFLGKNVRFKVIRQLDALTIGKIADKDDVVVFTDMGSGQLSLLEKHNLRKYYVIDHHPPEKNYPLQLNPHFHGFDGGIDVSGSSMAYLVSKSLGYENMAHIAVVGAVGDMQDNGGRLHSINTMVLEDAVAQGTMKVKHDLRIFGRQSRTLPQMLAYSSDPVFLELAGNFGACISFIETLGIKTKSDSSFRHYVDLSWEERMKLTTALYTRLLDLGTPEFVIQRMIGEVYTLLHEKKKTELRDAKEFSTLLNACGRQDRPEVGVRVCLGDREGALDEARDLLEKHRRMLSRGLDYLSSSGVEEMGSLYHFDGGGHVKESIIGVVAGMAYGARIIQPDKPVIAFALDSEDDSMLKVSSRANWGLVKRGLHLGDVMSAVGRSVGGEGGGHDVAAGARIPAEAKEKFLKKADEMIKNQLKPVS